MARPIKEGLDYFPHDTDAFNDEKIEILRFRHGAMGYMFYFFHLERIYRSPNAELLVSDAETKQIFARKLAVTEQEYEQILSTCIKYHCFDVGRYTKEGVLTSNGIQKRASIVIDKRNRMRSLYKENISDAETKQKLSRNCAETIAESTQSKVKKSKEEKSIKREGVNKFIPPTIEDITKYIKENNYSVDPNIFFKYFLVSNWVDSNGKRVKNWKQKIISWNGRNQKEYKKQSPADITKENLKQFMEERINGQV